MTTKDASLAAAGASIRYEPGSPFRTAINTIDFSVYGIGASGADTVNVLKLKKGEFVLAAYMRIEASAAASSTLKLDDSRTGGGAILAASAGDAAAGTTYKAAGAGVGVVGTTDAYLTLTTAAAVAVSSGKVTVYAVIGSAF